MKRAAIYTRVSTDNQAEHGYSLPSQLEACRKYAQTQGWIVSAELADDCSGSIPIVERPAGRQLYALVDSAQVQAVVIYTHDRTARDEAVLEYLLFKSHLHDKGVELHYSDTGLDAFTMESNLIGYIKAHGAAEERKKIRERTVRGRDTKARAGKIVLNTYATYGYRRQGDGYIIDEERASIVKLIYDWYTVERLSLVKIAARLNASGIPNPQYTRSKTAPHWQPTMVQRILKDETYIGIWHYGKTRNVNGKQVNRPPEEWIKVPVPELQIIPVETFQLAQSMIERNFRLCRRNQKHNYLLSGFFRCGACNRTMAGTRKRTRGKEYFFYRCTDLKWKKPPRCPNGPAKTVSVNLVEHAVMEWLESLFQDDETLRAGIIRMRTQAEAVLEPKRQRLQTIIGLIEKAERGIKNLAAAIREAENEIAAAALQAEMKNASKQLAGLTKEKGEVLAALQSQEIGLDAEQSILSTAVAIRARLNSPTFEQKRQLLDALNFEAIYYNDELGRRIFVSCSLGDKTIELHSA